VIDEDGFRPNVGIILMNNPGDVLLARRAGMDAWQFPQGGIEFGELPEEAMYRELREEIGLYDYEVNVIAYTKDWLKYRLPKKFVRQNQIPLCIGQKQIWFLLRLLGSDSRVALNVSAEPEFDKWDWVPYWTPADKVVAFKREVYRKALKELLPFTGYS
jgi:putative (di)nucleoside polyphosphate hydrolase